MVHFVCFVIVLNYKRILPVNFRTGCYFWDGIRRILRVNNLDKIIFDK